MKSAGPTYPRGYLAAGIYAGIKKRKKDLGLLVSKAPAATAAFFTTNILKGSSLLLNQQQLKQGLSKKGCLVVSGIANCCVGRQGEKDAKALVKSLAHLTQTEKKDWLLGTTGIIGTPLPTALIEKSLPRLILQLKPNSGRDFALATMTTDTTPKIAERELSLDKSSQVRIGGCAKGAGMIAPNLATLFAFITTDARLSPKDLRMLAKRAIEPTFQAITIDNDQSPCDMLLFFANGASGVAIQGTRKKREFAAVLQDLCLELAQGIVRDGEGAKKFVEICVKGAESKSSARRLGMAIARSLLVKTAFFGEDPNWGRILTVAGASGVSFELPRIKLFLNGRILFQKGGPTLLGLEPPSRLLKGEDIQVVIDLGNKKGACFTVYTTDLSYEYVKINAEYHT